MLRLRLQKPKSNKKVVWSTDTIDNEHMNKKKSKCMFQLIINYFSLDVFKCNLYCIILLHLSIGCCIYKRPLMFGESSSEDDEDCENCCGHPEKRRRNKKPPFDGDKSPNGDDHHDHPPTDEPQTSN